MNINMSCAKCHFRAIIRLLVVVRRFYVRCCNVLVQYAFHNNEIGWCDADSSIEPREDLKCSLERGFMSFARKLLFVSVVKA